jgi:mono/diheme cytochrome c family protein
VAGSTTRSGGRGANLARVNQANASDPAAHSSPRGRVVRSGDERLARTATSGNGDGVTSDGRADRRTPRWGLALGLLAVVSAGIFGLGKLAPFKPSADASAVSGGDPARGEALFATSCAGCHGAGGAGGGIGPTLAGVPRDGGDVAAVIAAGRGAMPANLVSGADAADVVAYVVSIGGGDPAGGGEPPAQERTGSVTLAGPRLQRLTIELDQPAPTGWAVWVDGVGGVRRVAAIDPGTRRFVVANTGIGSVAVESDTVLVGPSATAPALQADITGLGELLVTSPAGADDVGLVNGADGQIAVLREHIRFLRIALDEGNLANIRFHGEHMVNIALGQPIADVDGNGDRSNPGDGVGILGQAGRDGYLPRILTLAGPDRAAGDSLRSAVNTIAQEGRRCGQARSVSAGRPCVEAIAAREGDLVTGWQSLEDALRARTTTPLRRP